MHVNHLITQLLYDWNNLHIYNMGVSVGLESFFFQIEPFHISKICTNINMISRVYKKIFLGNSGHLRNHIWAF